MHFVWSAVLDELKATASCTILNKCEHVGILQTQGSELIGCKKVRHTDSMVGSYFAKVTSTCAFKNLVICATAAII